MARICFLLFFFLTAFFSSCSDSAKDTVDEDTIPISRKKPVLESKPGIVYPKLFAKSQRTPYEEATVHIGDSVYYCSYKGKIESSDTMKRGRVFIYDIRAEFMVDKLFISPLGNGKYFLNWQETDHNGVRTYVAVVEKGAAKPIWMERYALPNPGQAAIDGENVYVTALGLAANLNINDGAVKWKHDSLYSTVTLSYQKFQPVVVMDKQIVFIDYPVTGRRSKCDTLRVDPVSGLRLK